VDESGNVRETMLDGSGNVLEESASGDLADLPLEEEYRDEEGRTIGRARDDAGNVVEEELDERGNVAGFIGFVGANEVGRREATKAAERKAREMGVDLSGVGGTGSGGRILVRDVKKAAKNGG
jgi:pyruvate/2-oxoglutarate dehydrogenase complex dihydrolipoamide acyltransferase (E2) component